MSFVMSAKNKMMTTKTTNQRKQYNDKSTTKKQSYLINEKR